MKFRILISSLVSESGMRSGYIVFYILVIIFVICNIGYYYSENVAKDHGNKKTSPPLKPEDAYLIHRKLMLHGVCSKWDISISQSKYPRGGIPEFIVQIVNTCVSSGCAPSNIHLKCGWFASARTVNPRTFKRLSYDDCLVNAGFPLKTSQSIRFTYSNSFMYPLQFKSATFC